MTGGTWRLTSGGALALLCSALVASGCRVELCSPADRTRHVVTEADAVRAERECRQVCRELDGLEPPAPIDAGPGVPAPYQPRVDGGARASRFSLSSRAECEVEDADVATGRVLLCTYFAGPCRATR